MVVSPCRKPPGWFMGVSSLGEDHRLHEEGPLRVRDGTAHLGVDVGWLFHHAGSHRDGLWECQHEEGPLRVPHLGVDGGWLFHRAGKPPGWFMGRSSLGEDHRLHEEGLLRVRDGTAHLGVDGGWLFHRAGSNGDGLWECQAWVKIIGYMKKGHFEFVMEPHIWESTAGGCFTVQEATGMVYGNVKLG